MNKTVKGHQLLFKALVGSHSYGTNVEGSDIDYKGVYIQTPKSILYEGYIPQIEIGKDETYYEVGRFLALCETANPTVLELLYSPEDCVKYKHPVFDNILENRHLFLTKKCKMSFGGYAVQQIVKAKGLDKKMNWEKERVERKDILDFCYVHEGCGSTPVKEFLERLGLSQEQIGLVSLPHMRYCYAMYFDKYRMYSNFKPSGIARDLLNSNDVSVTSIPEVMEGTATCSMMYFNKDAYQMHCREYKEYQQWLKNRNTQRYVDVESHGQMIDGKNMLHCVRLLQTALEIPTYRVINVKRPNADYLKNIRHGKFNLEEIISYCEKTLKEMEESFDKSDLPEIAETSVVKAIAIKTREAFENLKKRQDVY